MNFGIGSGFLGLAVVRLVSRGWLLAGVAVSAGPLFVPHAGMADPRPSGAASEWHWRLAGVIVGPGLSEALFAYAGETRTVREGQPIDGWIVAAVRPHGITLRCAGEAKILSPEGLSPDEEAAAAQARAEQNAQAATLVSTALLQQQREQQTGETALANATRQMTRR